jgi:hypothetical protein
VVEVAAGTTAEDVEGTVVDVAETGADVEAIMAADVEETGATMGPTMMALASWAKLPMILLMASLMVLRMQSVAVFLVVHGTAGMR